MKDAVIDYACATKKSSDHLNISMQLVVKIIPYLASIDSRWKAVNSTNFRTHIHGRYRAFYDIVRQMLKDRKKLQAAIDERQADSVDEEGEVEIQEEESQRGSQDS